MQEQIKAAIHDYWSSVESLDPGRYRGNFAANATVEDPVGTNTIDGADAIAEFFRVGIQAWNIENLVSAIKQVITGAGESMEAAVVWEVTVYTKAGESAAIQGLGLFKFDPNPAGGRLLLRSVREFWNDQQLTSQPR